MNIIDDNTAPLQTVQLHVCSGKVKAIVVKAMGYNNKLFTPLTYVHCTKLCMQWLQ
jgi:hypothetical protein